VKFKDFVMAMKNMIFTEDEARSVVEVLKEKSSAIHDLLQKVRDLGWGERRLLKKQNGKRCCQISYIGVRLRCCILSLGDFFQLVPACFACRKQLSAVCAAICHPVG